MTLNIASQGHYNSNYLRRHAKASQRVLPVLFQYFSTIIF